MDEGTARLWVEKIIRVQSGSLTASEAAKQLSVSRKTFHKHQKELLRTMLSTLTERKTGRPPLERDEQVESLLREVSSLQEQVGTLEVRLKIRSVMDSASGKEKKGTCDGDNERTGYGDERGQLSPAGGKP